MEYKSNRHSSGKSNKSKWEIYPDYWKDSWGEKPLLGTVYAYDEQNAIRKAYDLNLLPHNFTFGPLAIKVN